MRLGREVVAVGSPEWLACCAYHVSMARGAGEAEAARAHDEALEEAVRAKSDWMQVFENDRVKAEPALKYPATRYDNRALQVPYYAGVEVPATYEKEYHASIIRVGQLEAEVVALRAEVTRLAEWRLMVEEQAAPEKLSRGEDARIAAGVAPSRIEDGASVPDERPADSPVTADVNKTIDHLINGRVVNDDVKRLGRAVDQVNRGATGPIRGIGG